MAIRDRPTNVIPLPNCRKCHEDKTIRMIHLLRMDEQGKREEEIRAHLQAQFPQWNKEDLASELGWMRTIIRFWAEIAREKKEPVWMTWFEANHFDVSRISTGWRMLKNRNY